MIRIITLLLLAIWRLFFDRRVPFWLKMLPVFAAIYVISPFDLRPDFMPGFGFIDDLLVTIVLLVLFVLFSPKEAIYDSFRRPGEERSSSPPGEQDNTVDGQARHVDDRSQPR